MRVLSRFFNNNKALTVDIKYNQGLAHSDILSQISNELEVYIKQEIELIFPDT